METSDGDPAVDCNPGRCFVSPLHRDRPEITGEQYWRVLCCRRTCAATRQRNGYRSRLDECGFLYLDGGIDLLLRVRWVRLFDGLDRWVCPPRTLVGSLLEKVRKIHGS